MLRHEAEGRGIGDEPKTSNFTLTTGEGGTNFTISCVQCFIVPSVTIFEVLIQITGIQNIAFTIPTYTEDNWWAIPNLDTISTVSHYELVHR